MLTKPLIRKAKEKIAKDCSILTFRLVAFAFTSSGQLVCAETNRWAPMPKRSIHAEEFLVQKLQRLRAKERLGEIKVTVVRIRKDGSLAMARPCIACQGMLRKYGVHVVNYTDQKGNIREVLL